MVVVLEANAAARASARRWWPHIYLVSHILLSRAIKDTFAVPSIIHAIFTPVLIMMYNVA